MKPDRHEVFARRWRPRTFGEVVGQEIALGVISASLSSGRVHHAYLLSGGCGTGKTTIARLLAQGLNCEEGITPNFCRRCRNCRDTEAGHFADLVEIDAASHTRIEDVRKILDDVQYLPGRGRYRIYLIDEVHMLSRYSFNALLKTLEEPPRHAKFLLATTDPRKIPPAVLSRCLRFHLRRLSDEVIAAKLEWVLDREKIGFDRRALSLIAASSRGSMRDALSLLEQSVSAGGGRIDLEATQELLQIADAEYPPLLLRALLQGDVGRVGALLEDYHARNFSWELLLLEIMSLTRDVSLIILSPESGGEDRSLESAVGQLGRLVTPEELQLYYRILAGGYRSLAGIPDPRLEVEMTLLQILSLRTERRRAEI